MGVMQEFAVLVPVLSLAVAVIGLLVSEGFRTAVMGAVARWIAPRHADVVVAVVVRDTSVLLVHRKPAVSSKLLWQFPASNLRPGEDPGTIAVKEVLAETGVEARMIRSLGIRRHPQTRRWCHYVACDWVAGDGENRDPDENIYVRWVEKGNVPAYIQTDLFPEAGRWIN